MSAEILTFDYIWCPPFPLDPLTLIRIILNPFDSFIIWVISVNGFIDCHGYRQHCVFFEWSLCVCVFK